MRLDVTDTGTTSGLSEQVAEEIRAILGRRRMSQAALARALKVSPMWVNYRLTGTQPIDLNDLERIAAVLDVEVVELFPVREGRLVTHAGATRRQTTVPKIGSLTALAKRPSTGRPRGRTAAVPPIVDSARRVSRVLANAA